MKQLLDCNDESLWSCGCSTFLQCHEMNRWRLPVAVKCCLGNLEATELALLDTGAEWSVIGSEIAELVEDDLFCPTDSFAMSTRKGTIQGTLHRIKISLLAEQSGGTDLSVEGTVFVSKDWNGPTVLGYRGFLERIRFALDPGNLPNEQKIYFGSVR